MRIMRIFLLLAVMAMLTGCASWRDVQGNVVPESVKNECNRRCGYYENNQGPYTYKVCFKDCMGEKGFTKN